MLPSKVRENAQRAVTLAMDERFGALGATMEGINSDYASRGLGQSGVRIGAIEKALKAEAAIMANEIERAICDVYESLGCVAEESHRAELKSLFDEAFRHAETALPQTLDSQARLTPLPGIVTNRLGDALTSTFSHLRKKQHLAIDMYIDSRLHASTPAPSPVTNTYNIGAPVGVFQTGDGAIANISGVLSQGEQTAALEALAQAMAAIIKAPAGKIDTARLLSVAAEASENVKAANPDRSKLRQAFDVLSSGVQAIGSAPQAYSAVQAVLAMLG